MNNRKIKKKRNWRNKNINAYLASRKVGTTYGLMVGKGFAALLANEEFIQVYSGSLSVKVMMDYFNRYEQSKN